MSSASHIGIICIALPHVRFSPVFTEPADFAVGNGINDTCDTKPPLRDTPTIHGITTMSVAGVIDADFVAEADP
jgi:hypothetical protein